MTQTKNQPQRHDRSVPGAISLAGAALAGLGIGALIWWNFGPIGWSLVVVGSVAFLFGKIGARQR